MSGKVGVLKSNKRQSEIASPAWLTKLVTIAKVV